VSKQEAEKAPCILGRSQGPGEKSDPSLYLEFTRTRIPTRIPTLAFILSLTLNLTLTLTLATTHARDPDSVWPLP